jgi:hypothetical protein
MVQIKTTLPGSYIKAHFYGSVCLHVSEYRNVTGLSGKISFPYFGGAQPHTHISTSSSFLTAYLQSAFIIFPRHMVKSLILCTTLPAP